MVLFSARYVGASAASDTSAHHVVMFVAVYVHRFKWTAVIARYLHSCVYLTHSLSAYAMRLGDAS